MTLPALVSGICLLILLSAFPGCSGDAEAGDYAASVREYRDRKDRMMRGGDSPLPASRRSSFTGLRYYPPDSVYRVVARLERRVDPDTLELGTSTGESRRMVRLGTLRFPVPGRSGTEQRLELELFRTIGEVGEPLFLPFADLTSGTTTYGSGRYLDVGEPDAENRLTLDFNYAYNPYCAYNPGYSCPLVPESNVLPVRIEAGERLPRMEE